MPSLKKSAPKNQPASWLPLSAHVCYSLYSASLAMTKVYNPLLKPLGLTYPQYLVLVVLWENAPQTVSDLGAALNLDSGTLTPLLKKMEAAQLLRRERNRADERQVLIHLTELGEAKRAELNKVPACVVQSTGMTMTDLNALKDVLDQLRDQLQQSVSQNKQAIRKA
jgi:MarR family transcriptional regulator, organic hydroperoxide resistance regulator